MAELTFDIVELVLKKVADYCKEHEECKGCRFSKIIKGDNHNWYDCRIGKEPHIWEFADKEGAEE